MFNARTCVAGSCQAWSPNFGVTLHMITSRPASYWGSGEGRGSEKVHIGVPGLCVCVHCCMGQLHALLLSSQQRVTLGQARQPGCRDRSDTLHVGTGQGAHHLAIHQVLGHVGRHLGMHRGVGVHKQWPRQRVVARNIHLRHHMSPRVTTKHSLPPLPPPRLTHRPPFGNVAVLCSHLWRSPHCYRVNKGTHNQLPQHVLLLQCWRFQIC